MNPSSREPPPDRELGGTASEASGRHERPLPPLDSRTLLGAAGERLIIHQGETYRLRQTRSGKLILYK